MKPTKQQLAGRKAAETRKANKEAKAKKWSEAGRKAARTRRKNKLKFHNENGPEKIKRRELKAKAYKDSGVQSGPLLFMPSQTCADVEVINRFMPRNKFLYVGSEINEAAKVEIRQKIKKNGYNMALFGRPISELVFDAVKDEYAHLDLDFCETFSRYKATLGMAIAKKIVGINGIISGTFSARDGKITKTAREILGAAKIKELRAIDKKACLVVPALEQFIKNHGGYSYKFICEPEIYSDSAKGNHMVFFIIQRVK